MSYNPYPQQPPPAPVPVPVQQQEEEPYEYKPKESSSTGYTIGVVIAAIFIILLIIFLLLYLNKYKNSSNSFPFAGPRGLRSLTNGFVGMGTGLVPFWPAYMRAGLDRIDASASWELDVLNDKVAPEGTFYCHLVTLYGAQSVGLPTAKGIMQVSDINLGNTWPPKETGAPTEAPLEVPNLGAWITYSAGVLNSETTSLAIWEFTSVGNVTELGAPFTVRLREFPEYNLDIIPLNNAYQGKYPGYSPMYVTKGTPKIWNIV